MAPLRDLYVSFDAPERLPDGNLAASAKNLFEELLQPDAYREIGAANRGSRIFLLIATKQPKATWKSIQSWLGTHNALTTARAEILSDEIHSERLSLWPSETKS